MLNDEFFILSAFFYCLLLKKYKRKQYRSKWSKKWFLKRRIYSHVNLINELRAEPDDWRNYLRMDETAYTELLGLVTPLIERQNTVMRDCISPHERLTCTLRFLATGRSYRDLRFTTAISHQALSIIIPDTCRAIYKVLSKKYMKVDFGTSFIIKISNYKI